VPISAYLDGAVKGDMTMTLTCLAATEDVWGLLEPLWKQVCKEHGDVPYVHMTDLWSCEGIYKGWKEEQRDAFINALVAMLMPFMDYPNLQQFTCQVDLAAHARWKTRRNLPSPARFCARIAFPQMVDWFYRPQQSIAVDVIDAFFDQNELFMRHIRADWKSKKIKQQYPIWNLVRVIEEADMKKTPALQMADFICWGHHRVATYIHPRPWEIDFQGWVTAVSAKNAVRGTVTPLSDFQFRTGTFLEEGQALIELWNRRRIALVSNPSEEYKKFDRMMQRLIHVPHDNIKTALEAERADKQKKRKAKKPSASGRASSDKD
jgi:hypothetical protein